MDNYNPLTREEMIAVIEGKGAARRVPMMYHFWTDPTVFGAKKTRVNQLLTKYPYDITHIKFNMPKVFDAPTDDPNYRWANYDNPYGDESVGLDEMIAIPDWAQLDAIIDNFPDPNYTHLLTEIPADDGSYRLGHWWYLLFERLWSLRGMTNALMDFYLYPEQVHRLLRKITDFYLVALERGKTECQLDGVIISDDIGTQTGPFFSHDLFSQFIKPYYKELIDKAHSLNMHFGLHTCGNVEIFIPDLVEIGLDVLHPIQKYTMDEKKIADQFGHDICIWAGFDVQQIIPFGTPEEVRKEVRFMIDTYYRPEGRLILTAGNGITGDTPIESFKALLDETFIYGSHKK